MMKRKGIILMALFCLFATLAPYNTIAEEETQVQSTEEVTPVESVTTEGVVEEPIEGVEEMVSPRTQLVAKTPRTVTYPATIDSIFPDPALAQGIATILGKQPTDTVTKANLETIESVDIRNKGIANITGIDELSKLTRLNLKGNEVSDLSVINWDLLAPTLQYITLDSNKVSDLSVVNWNNFKELKGFSFEDNQITNIVGIGLEGAVKLEYVWMQKNQIENVTDINWSSFPQMDTINFSENKISDISTIDFTGLGKVVNLYFSYNTITDDGIRGIDWSGLSSLYALVFYSNQITDPTLIGWNDLSTLVQVDLRVNKISDLSRLDLSGMPLLVDFSLENQAISVDEKVYSSQVTLDNPVLDFQGNKPALSATNNNGSYDATTQQHTWNLSRYIATVSCIWSEEFTINGNVNKFSGWIDMPLERTYKLVFKNYDGTILNQEEKVENATITAPTNLPLRAGYTFIGWTPELAAKMPAQDVEYVATYKLEEVNPVPTSTPITTPTPTLNPGRTCQDDGYPKGYDWNGTACVLQAGYKVPNTGVK